VAAAYKELAWAYGMGLIKKEELEQELNNVLAIQGDETVICAANADEFCCIAAFGSILRNLHLMEDISSSDDKAIFPVVGNNEITMKNTKMEKYSSIRPSILTMFLMKHGNSILAVTSQLKNG